MRNLLRGVAGLLGLGVGLTALIVQVYRPTSWRSTVANARPAASDAARLRADVESFPPFRSRAHAPALAAMEALVQARLESLGWQVARQDVASSANPHRPVPAAGPVTHNVVATRARAASGPLFVVGAHLDAVAAAPGADDNGSGVAVLLELARLLTPDVAARVELVFFNEEEEGLHGSYTFVVALPEQDCRRIAAAYVTDMVGFFDTRAHSQTYPPPLSWLAPDRGDFLSVIALTDADAALRALHAAHDRVASDLPLEVFEPPRPLARKLPDLWRSDHAPFWEAGIPAVFFTDTGNFRSDRYHTPRDTADELDYRQMARFADLLLDVLNHPAP